MRAMPSKSCDLKSSAMRSMHSCGPVADVGSMPKKPGNISFVMSIPACVWAIRGSVYSVAVSGGGQGAPASQVRTARRAVSLASRKLRAVEPVRGSPSPNSGATISCSAISGCREYHCSTSSRLTRRPTIWSIITLSPNSLSADSAVSEPTRISRPSRHVSSPKSSEPARATAVSTSCSTSIPMAPVPRPGCAGTSATPYGIRPLESGSGASEPYSASISGAHTTSRRLVLLLRRAAIGLKSCRHILLGPPFSLERDGGQDLPVRRRQRRLHQTPRPEVPCSDHIELGGVEGDLGGQVQEGEESENERKRAVLLARVAQRMLHQDATEVLQNRPSGRTDECTRQQIAPWDLLRRE